MAISKATASSIAPAAKGDLVVGSATNDSGVLAVGSANQVLTVDSSTATGLKWAAPTSGITLISTTTFSNVASQLVSSCFTSTYTNYRIVFNSVYNNSGTNENFRMQGLTGTVTPITASNYNSSFYVFYTAGEGVDNFASNASWTVGKLSDQSSEGMGGSVDIYAPNVGNKTYGNLSYSTLGPVQGGVGALSYNAATAMTGIKLFCATGNITGTVSIYGLAK